MLKLCGGFHNLVLIGIIFITCGNDAKGQLIQYLQKQCAGASIITLLPSADFEAPQYQCGVVPSSIILFGSPLLAYPGK